MKTRTWCAYHMPEWMRRPMCRLGWHYWRYNVLIYGTPDPTIRHCEDAGCGTVQDLQLKPWKWVSRQGKGFGGKRMARL